MEAGQGQVAKPGGSKKASKTKTFPFLRMPTELQWRVWSLFCPELTVRPFVLYFLIDEHYGEVEGTGPLSENTASVRKVLAVHQGSRQFALRALPDTLAFGGGFHLVRFRKERDVVRLGTDDSGPLKGDVPGFRFIPRFSEFVVNLVIASGSTNNAIAAEWLKLYCCLPNLRVLYDEIISYDDGDLGELTWCQSAFVHRALGGMNFGCICFPDLLRHRHYAKRHVRTDKFPAGVDVMTWAQWRAKDANKSEGCLCILTEKNLDHLGNIKMWPLVWAQNAHPDGSSPW